MKKSLILGLLGLAVSVASSFGQGFIALDNYDSTVHPLVTYGNNVPANGIGGGPGTPGSGLLAGWTVGLYFAQGNVTGSVGSDPTGIADPATLGGGLLLATGPGSTAAVFTSTFGTPGQFFTPNTFQASAAAPGSTVTIMLIAYSGADYASAAYRGHSSAFTMTTAAGNAPVPNYIGDFMSSFSVQQVPEPSTFALAGLGAAAMLIIRRRK